MFDTYTDAHDLDPQLRRRMTLAVGTAAIASALVIVGYMGAEKLSISRVGAPQVELDVLIASTVASPVSAPPPPSPPAAATAEPAEAEPAARESATEPAIEDVLDAPRPRSGGGHGSDAGRIGVPGTPGQIPGQGGGGGMPCVGATCAIGVPAVVPPRAPPQSTTAKVPLEVAQGRLRYSPDPPRDALLATRAGSLGRGGTSVVAFCVGTDGKVDEVRTKRSAGDGDVDRICREALRRWRFSPLEVQGRATRMCSEFAFVIAFE